MANDINILVKLQDMATSGLKNIQSGLTAIGKEANAQEKKLKDFNKGLDQLSKAGTTLAVGAGAVAGTLGAIGFAAVKAASDWEQLQTSFEVMIGDIPKANKLLQEIKETAASTPLELQDLASGGKTLLAFGVSAEKLIPTMRMLGDVAGGDKERFKSLSLAFGQMSSAGRLMGQDLLQMINVGFNPLQVISQKTGISMRSLKKQMEAGAISSEMVAEAFKIATSEGGQFYKMMEKQSQTLQGKVSTMNDAFAELARTIGNILLPIITPLVDGITWLVDLITKLPSPLQKAVVLFGTLVAIVAALLVPFGAFLAILPAMIEGWGALTFAVSTFGIALNVATLGIPLMIAGFVLLILKINEIADWVNKLPGIFKFGFYPLIIIINSLKLSVDGLVAIFSYLPTLFDGIGKTAKDVFVWIVEKISTWLDSLTWLNGLMQILQLTIIAIGDGFKLAIKPVVEFFQTIIDQAKQVSKLIGELPFISNFVKKESKDTKQTTDNKNTNKKDEINTSVFSSLSETGSGKKPQKIDYSTDLKNFQESTNAKTSIEQQALAKRINMAIAANASLEELENIKKEMDLANTQQKLKNLDEFYAAEKAKVIAQKGDLATLDIFYAEQKLKLEQDRIAQEEAARDAAYIAESNRNAKGLIDFKNSIDFRKKMTEQQKKDFMEFQNFISGAVSSQSKEAAAIAKAMAIYDIGLKTVEATIAAYKFGMSIGGPFLAIPFAGAAIAYGAEQASKVASMQPALAEGGMVRSTIGGQSVTVAEAGKDEAVIPLDDPATAQRIQNAAGGGGGQTIQLVVDNMVLAETVVQGYNKGQNIGRVSKLK